jgi:hypothetical protein
MNRELIGTWLRLPAGSWPPDHYALLGLERGQGTPEQIEQSVQERLGIVRRYQLAHQEEATEAMTLLAQAFVCLSDPAGRKAYDAELLGPSAPAEQARPAAPEEPEAPVELAAPLEVRRPPPRLALPEIPIPALPREQMAPVAVPALPATPAAVAEPAEAPGTFPFPVEVVPASVAVETPARERVDPAVEAAEKSPAARRGLGTKRALYRRLAQTRQVARDWEQAGKYLAWPKRRVSRPEEATELIAFFGALRTSLRGFPPLLGTAGQPGYLVASLARQQTVVPTFQTLLANQREALARDWWAGRTLLQTHREYLRQELRGLRKKSTLGRIGRAVRAFLTDQPGWLLLLLALVAINIAIWRSLALDWEAHSPPPTASERPAN